jgi:hypothetical protein
VQVCHSHFTERFAPCTVESVLCVLRVKASDGTVTNINHKRMTYDLLFACKDSGQWAIITKKSSAVVTVRIVHLCIEDCVIE